MCGFRISVVDRIFAYIVVRNLPILASMYIYKHSIVSKKEILNWENEMKALQKLHEQCLSLNPQSAQKELWSAMTLNYDGGTMSYCETMYS